MPIYEYQCAACLHQFELLQKINDEPVTKCPVCFKDKAQRLISAAGFQLKGTGWYVTDFKNKGAPPQKEDNAKTQNSSGEKTKSDSGAESKSATKKKGEHD